MGAWAEYTIPSTVLHNISVQDFGASVIGAEVHASAPYMTRAKGRLQSYLRAPLASFIVSAGDAAFFDSVASSAPLADALDHALALGYAYAYYWDKMVNVDDQWSIRARAMDAEMKEAAKALSEIIPGAVGSVDGATTGPAVSAITTIIGRSGNISTGTFPTY